MEASAVIIGLRCMARSSAVKPSGAAKDGVDGAGGGISDIGASVEGAVIGAVCVP